MLRERFFAWLTRLIANHTTKVLVAGGVLTLISLFFAKDIRVKTSFVDTLGTEDPVSKQQAYMQENFPGTRTLQVLLEGPDQEELIEAARAIETQMLAADDRVRAVYLEEPIDFFIDHGLLYMPLDNARVLEDSFTEWKDPLGRLISDPSFLGLVRLFDEMSAKQTAISDSVFVITSKMFGRVLLDGAPWQGPGMEVGLEVDTQPMRDLIAESMNEQLRDTPLPSSATTVGEALVPVNGVLSLIADTLEQGEHMTPERFGEEIERLRAMDFERLGASVDKYRFSPDKSSLLMEVAAHGNLLDIEVVQSFLPWFEEELDKVRLTYPGVEIRATGLPAMLSEESNAIIDNFILVTILGFIGILSVFVIGFERIGLPSLAVIPLLMGLLWNMGLIGATSGGVTLLAMMFPVLLFGIGIDFAIHLLAGYSERRSAGANPEEALVQTFERIGAGLITGGVTTAAAFLVMMNSDYYGLRDLGFVAGMGILLALTAMVVILPAVLLTWDRRNADKGDLLPNVPFHFLEDVGRFTQRHRYPTLACFLVVTIVLGYSTSKVTLDDNYLNIVPEGLPSLDAQDTILEKFGISNEFVVFFAKDLEHAERIRVLASEAKAVGEVISPASLIPAGQDLKRPHIENLARQIAALPQGPEGRVHRYDSVEIGELRESLAEVKRNLLEVSLAFSALYDQETQDVLGETRDVINRIDRRLTISNAEHIRHLDKLIGLEVAKVYGLLQRMVSNTSVTEQSLPASILDRFQGVDGSWMVLVRGSGDVWESDVRQAFLNDVRGIDDAFSGLIPTWDHMLTLIIGEISGVVTTIVFVVLLLVLADLRSIRGTLLAATPLAIGLIWTFGVLGMFGISFNILNVMAIPLIVGIGIDDGVHIYHRIRKEGEIPGALSHSGKAVILTSLTTGIGFGSLMMSVHPGLYSLGIATSIGIFSCLLVSLFLMPALIAIFNEDILTAEEKD
jgi:uncharacterized protein